MWSEEGAHCSQQHPATLLTCGTAALPAAQVPGAAALAGLPPVQLSRYDLHHGHLFLSAAAGGQLGLLLHCKEYPAECCERFPVHLGRCQCGSSLEFDDDAMDSRNLVWCAAAGQGRDERCLACQLPPPLHPSGVLVRAAQQ